MLEDKNMVSKNLIDDNSIDNNRRGIFEKYKYMWALLVLTLIVIVSLFIMKDYLFLQKEKISEINKEKLSDIEQPVISDIEQPVIWDDIEQPVISDIEQTIAKEKEECLANFNLNKLDSTKPIWNSELPTMLKGLLVLRAIDQDNRDLCNFEMVEINPSIRKERCERDYDFFFILTEKLKKGIDAQKYVEECQEALIPYLFIEKEQGVPDIPDDIGELKEGLEVICRSYYQTFQNKTPNILDSDLMCGGLTAKDYHVMEYIDPQTNQVKSCRGEFNDDIDFLIAIAKNDPALCSIIDKFRTSQYCHYFFNRDITPFYNEFKESYCHSLVHKALFPSR